MSSTHYPKADRSTQDFSRAFAGSAMKPNCVILHSTEGTSWPGYNGGGTAPHFTARPDFAARRLVWRQHYPINRSARALENRAGGVETNTANVIQVEIVGTCDPRSHKTWPGQHLFMPEPPEWAIRDLADFLRWVDDVCPAFELRDGAPRGWVAYPASYANGKGQRMSAAEWRAFYGVAGHQHVPENSHGDPGALPIAKIIAAAKGTPTAPVIVAPAPEPTAPTPAPNPPTPAKTSTSFLLVNCASKRSDIGAGSWAKRRPILAEEILASDASFIVCAELYSGQRASLAASIKDKYSLAGYREGRVIFYRKGRWTTPAGSWWRNLRAGRKPSVVDKFTKVDGGAELTLFGLHLTWEIDKAGDSRRAAEVRSVVAWARKSHAGHGRRIYAGDVNSPAGGTTRDDVVGPTFAALGYHDLGIEAGARVGKGRYHLDRVFGGKGVRGKRVVVNPTRGSDHPLTYVEIEF